MSISFSGNQKNISQNICFFKPLKEIRVKADYEHYKEINGAQGIKILAKNLEKVIAGLPLFVAHREDELEVLRFNFNKILKKNYFFLSL